MYKMKRRKAQAAMEYLMTYGWAILIILIALGALFYLGVFRPKTSNMCVGAPPVTCTDVKVTEANGGTVELIVGAVGTDSAYISELHLTSPVVFDGSGAGYGAGVTDLAEAPGSLTIPNTGVAAADEGKKFVGTATVVYTLEGSGLEHASVIQFSGSVEAP